MGNPGTPDKDDSYIVEYLGAVSVQFGRQSDETIPHNTKKSPVSLSVGC